MSEKAITIENWTFEYEGKKLPATVPGDISADLMNNKIIEDVLFSDNYKKSAWVHEREWVYQADVLISSQQLGSEKAKLVFYGVDTYSKIYFNGRLIGQTDNMFIRYTFDIKPFAVIGENELKVVFSPVRSIKALYPNGKYLSCFDDNRVLMRKVQCHFGWDWAPNFPGLGLYEKVEAVFGDDKNIEWVQVRAHNDGSVSFLTELSAKCPGATITAEVESIPGKGFDGAYKTVANVLGLKNIVNTYVKSPLLWYPVGYGDSPLYNYRITLNYQGGTSVKEGHFAFREFEIKENPYQNDKISFEMFINGVPFRVIGSNWVPASAMTGTVTDSDYDRLISDAKECGINMLRVWGGGLYEKTAFYDCCDKYGIAVWQDFMFSCCDIPDDRADFVNIIKAEAEYQIKRLRNYPSIVIWSGGNELTDSFRYVEQDFGKFINRVLLAGLVHDLDGTRRYLWDCPYSLTEVGDNANSGDCHRNALSVATAHNDIINFRKYQWNNDNAFDTECAVLGMCRMRSLRKFMPDDRIWPQNDLWEDRFSCNPYDDSVVSFTKRLTMSVNSMFGGYDGLEDFVKKSMTVHSEVLRGEIEYFRSLDKNNGLMNWMYNDIWGNGTWSIIDYSGERKPAFYAMKRAGARLTLSIVMKKDGYKVFVINDTPARYKAPLEVAHIKLSGEVISKQSFTADVQPFGKQSFDLKFDESVKNAFLYAESNWLDTVYFYDLWKDKKFETDVDIDFKIKPDNKSGMINVSANKFARMVFIDFPDGFRVNLSDNYFDVPAGKNKTVAFTCDKEVSRGDISVLTFADKWLK